MDLTNYKLKLKKTRIFTKEQALAEELWLGFNKRLPFPRIMRMIKEKGYQFVFEIFKESKEGREPLSLFLWLYKQTKMQEIK